MRISDWSSDVCSSDLILRLVVRTAVRTSERSQGWCSPSRSEPVTMLDRCSLVGCLDDSGTCKYVLRNTVNQKLQLYGQMPHSDPVATTLRSPEDRKNEQKTNRQRDG